MTHFVILHTVITLLTALLKPIDFCMLYISDIVVDNCAICRNHIMDLCKY